MTTQHLIVATLLVLNVLAFSEVNAKRGCAAFGHSCYGGHGKRSSEYINNEMSDQNGGMKGRSQDDSQGIRSVYPLEALMGSPDDIIPVREGGPVYLAERQTEDDLTNILAKMHIRNIVKHWMNTYRHSDQYLDAQPGNLVN